MNESSEIGNDTIISCSAINEDYIVVVLGSSKSTSIEVYSYKPYFQHMFTLLKRDETSPSLFHFSLYRNTLLVYNTNLFLSETSFIYYNLNKG